MKSEIAPAPERVRPVAPPERSPFPSGETEVPESYEIDEMSEADLAEALGGAAPIRDEDVFEDDGKELPDIDVVRKRIPEKTQVLMEELFRAKLEKVQRVNPKKIR